MTNRSGQTQRSDGDDSQRAEVVIVVPLPFGAMTRP
jgi:hypothetical protein